MISTRRDFVKQTAWLAGMPAIIPASVLGKNDKLVTSNPALLKTRMPADKAETNPAKHVREFLDCIKSRAKPACNSTVARYGHIACHAAAISWKLDRKVRFDPKTEAFIDDAEADKMRSYERRAPWGL